MKIYKLLIFFLVFSLGFILTSNQAHALDPYRKLCVGIQGKFTATNWTGGPIQVGCVGDNGLATNDASQRCTGEVQTVTAGKTFRLTKCSCWGSNKGCLIVGKELKREPLKDGKRRITVVHKIENTGSFKNNKCTINDTSRVCGSNGKQITGNIKITCAPKSTPTPTKKPSATPSVSVTPTPTPSPSVCPVPKVVPNVRVSCPDCFSEQDLQTIAPQEEVVEEETIDEEVVEDGFTEEI